MCESWVKFESFKKKIRFLNFILIPVDCDSCFHNVAPTAAKNINSPRDIFPVERSREFIPGVGSNLLNGINSIPLLSSSSINLLIFLLLVASEQSFSIASLLKSVAQDTQNTSKTLEIILPRNPAVRRKLINVAILLKY